MKHILIILLSIVSVTVYSQSPRIKLNQIVKDNAKGSILISSPTDSQMVYSRDFFINFGADTTLVLFGDTIGGGISTVVTDLVTIQGDGSVSTPLYVDTSVINTIKGMVDTLTARGYLTTEVDGSTTNEIQTLSKAGQTVSLSLSGGSFTDDVLTESEVDAFVANNGYLTAEVDGSVTNELQTISTDNTAGNITLSNSGGTLTLNVNDADADATNEGSLTVQAGGANDSEIQSNTSGSSNVVIAGGSNVTVTESGQTITIASTATGGGGSIPVDTFVTIAGTDTITGAKTFSQKIDINKSTQGEYFRGAASSQGFYLNMTSTSNSFNGDKHIINADGFSGEIALSSDGTEILTISSDDKVGILTNAPGANLDVRATGSGNDNAFLVSGLIGQNLLEVDTDGDLIVDTSTLYVDATQNRVGIGTTSPSAKLDLVGDAEINGKLIANAGNNTITIGVGAGSNNTSTSANIYIGNQAGYSNTSGTSNAFIGDRAGYNNTTAVNNTFIGYLAGYESNGNNNLFIGHQAGRFNTSGVLNNAIGTNAGYSNISGSLNNYIGTSAGFYNKFGSNNTYFGYLSAYNNKGSGNINIGPESGRYESGTTNALDSTTNNVYIGGFIKGTENSTNEIVIGRSAEGIGSNTVRIGNSSITTIEGQVSFSTPSDARDKKNVQPLNDGLNIINALRPVKYVWHTRDNAKVDVNDIGFIAQEVDAVQYEGIDNDYLNLVNYNSVIDRWTITNAKFTPIIVKAIQEQQAIIETQQTEIDQLKTLIADLTNRLIILENK